MLAIAVMIAIVVILAIPTMLAIAVMIAIAEMIALSRVSWKLLTKLEIFKIGQGRSSTNVITNASTKCHHSEMYDHIQDYTFYTCLSQWIADLVIIGVVGFSGQKSIRSSRVIPR